jgi:hypothetical protein
MQQTGFKIHLDLHGHTNFPDHEYKRSHQQAHTLPRINASFFNRLKRLMAYSRLPAADLESAAS